MEERTGNLFIKGEKIFLREVDFTDVNEQYLRWMNDREINQYLESRFFPQSLEKLEAFVRSMKESKQHVFLAIIDNLANEHIGNIKLGPIDWIHRRAEIGFLIGNKSYWGKGYATEAIRLVVQYAFDTLNVHKVTAGCYSTNVGSVKAMEKVGFMQEGVLKEHCFCNGRYVDIIRFGIIKSEP
ncbi:MAG: N-acetyltransferase [Candidatus Omnitrophota bacterium]|jgi:RimJ/RimL family protein N-acetyltransferase|nr:MAG: N-acetyltransferase [Candidatus Omnitrophota bacterium]